MPINTKHLCLPVWTPKWQRVRDSLGGRDAMRCGGYIPKLHGQAEEAYATYTGRACYYAAPQRALAAMVGIVTRKTPTVIGIEQLANNLDLRGNGASWLAREIVRELASVGWAGSLVDWSEAESRPYVVTYKAEHITNWRMEYVGGKPRLAMLVLESCEEEPDAEDRYCSCSVRTWRAYELRDGFVIFSRAIERGEQIHYLEERVLARRGVALKEIPWVWHSLDAPEEVPSYPPLLDVVDVSISHFQNSADLENGRHMAGIPTPYAIGFGDGDLPLGSARAWTTDEVNAKAGFVEFTGTGLSSLKEALEEKERQMAMLGSRLLEVRAKAAEAAETVQLRNESESSTLVTIAEQASKGLRTIAQWLDWWQSTLEDPRDSEAEIALSSDLATYGLSRDLIDSITGAYFRQAISFETMFYQLQRAGMYSEEDDIDAERQRLSDAQPPGLPAPAPVPSQAEE